jgi:hypothetical protein
MATGTVKISGIGTSEKVKTKAEAPAAKPSKSNKCAVCGMKTNQKDGMCVLCKTGITQSYGELKELLNMNNKQG